MLQTCGESREGNEWGGQGEVEVEGGKVGLVVEDKR